MQSDFKTKRKNASVDAVRVVALAYDIYSNPAKNNGVLRVTLTIVAGAQRENGRAIVLAWPIFQPRSGVSRGVIRSLVDVSDRESFTLGTSVTPSARGVDR